VSKDFDSTLSDALDLAANAAQTAGPTAARIRGRQRTMRKRIALSTASLALFAAGTTAAFQATSSPHDGSPALTHPSPTVSVSTAPTPSAAPSQSATGAATPSTVVHTGSSASSSAPPSNTQTAADPHQVVAGAWLQLSQMPFASTFDWKADQATSQGGPIGQALTPTVFYFPNDTSFQTLTGCGDPTAFLGRTIGAQHTEYTGTKGTGNNQASQFIFFFASATAAQQAYSWLMSQYSASCTANLNGNVQLTNPLHTGTGSVWLTVAGVSQGGGDVPAYEREYFVVQGSTITYVRALSYSQVLPTAYDDTAQLGLIESRACVIAGVCQ
jgi:hypothetical protein